MRLLWGLAGLTLIWSLCGPLSAQPKELVRGQGAWPRDVRGLGKDKKEAKKNALRAAVIEINASLQIYKVDEEYVEKHAVDQGHFGEKEEGDEVWVLNYRTDNDWRKEIDRRDRATQRQTWTFRAIIGLSVLLLGGFSYVRLDEYTHRRYTTWLRVLGAGVATSVVAGWWWAFFQV